MLTGRTLRASVLRWSLPGSGSAPSPAARMLRGTSLGSGSTTVAICFRWSARPYDTSPIEQRIKQDLSTFGEDLGPYASVVRTYPQRAEMQRTHFAELPWPTDIGKRLRDPDWVDPVILILDREYTDFDPRQHQWAIVWLEDYNPDTLYKVFTKLARMVRAPDGDIIERLRRSAAEGKVSQPRGACSASSRSSPACLAFRST